MSKGNLSKPTLPSTVALILWNQLNNFSDDTQENELKLRNCKYGEIDYFQKLSRGTSKGTPCHFFRLCLQRKHLSN